MTRNDDNVLDQDLVRIVDCADDYVQILGVSVQNDGEELPVQSVEIDGENAIIIDVDSMDDPSVDSNCTSM